MTVQRFLPEDERTRRGAGWVFIGIALALFAGLAWLIVRTGHVGGTTMFLSTLPAGSMALGLYLALRRKEVLEIDLEQRTFAVVRKGVKSGSGTLDSLGPLTVKQRTRVTGEGERRRTMIEYVVSAAVHSGIDLYVMNTPGKARQKMEALARGWRLSCQSYGGALRAPDALDVPLHERLRGDREARAVVPLSAEWGVRIEPLSPGYAIVSTHRSWPALRSSGIVLFVIVLLFWASPARLRSFLPEVLADPLGRVLGGLMVVAFLAMLWLLWRTVRDAFYPGTVRVTEEGVSYRGSRMRFRDIEEVTAALPIELVGDRRILRLAETFCPPGALKAVAHELQRLILEVGERSGGQA